MRTLHTPSKAARGLALVSLLGLGLAGLALLLDDNAAAGTAAGPVEATFDDAFAKDVLLLATTDAGGEDQVTFTVPAGSTLSLTAVPDDTIAADAAGLALRLCDPTGADLMVAGGPYDKSNPEKDKIKWKNVPLETFGVYTLFATAATPGGMKATLEIADASGKFNDESAEGEDLPRNTPASVEYEGRAGDTLKFELQKQGSKSKFKGVAIRLVEADGTIRTDIPEKDKGKIVLESDGTGSLVFLNDGTQPAAWKSKLTVKPRSAKKRTVRVSAAQTGIKPKVTSVTPKKGVNKDTALRVTIEGRDFTEGMDVRLQRKKRSDIIGRDVQFVSSEEVNCLLNLDTEFRDGQTSNGDWDLTVWSSPVYGDDSDPTTLDEDTPLVDDKKTFKSVSAGSVDLPDGVEDDTEVWELHFNSAFQTDLDAMGLGSSDNDVQNAVNEIVRAYVVAYIRDLMLVNETNGKLTGSGVPISFVVASITRVAGVPGVDYNRIEIGGKYDADTDPSSPLEPLDWGFAPFDPGNTHRDDLSIEAEDGTYLGYGARTRVLDPRTDNDQASSNWRQSTLPLRLNPLRSDDARYITGAFNANNPAQIQRFTDIVHQIERSSREIAAITAHQIGRAMGLVSPGDGPMAAPSFSGEMWIGRQTLSFSDSDRNTLTALAVPSDLPGKSDALKILYFPLIDSQPEFLTPDAFTGLPYDIKWDYVGGRCNAVPADYLVTYARGSVPPLGLNLNFEGLSGTPPVCISGSCTSAGNIYCGVLEFAVIVQDVTRSGGSFLLHRLRVLPTVSLLPSNLQPQGQACRDTVSNAR